MADCNSWFDCGDEKKQNLGWFQILKLLITKDANGCPALRTKDTSNTGGGGGGGGTVTPVQRTLPSSIIATSNGSILAGAIWAELITSPDFVGTINGSNYPAGFGKIFPVLAYRDTYPAIPYTISAGNIRVEYLT